MSWVVVFDESASWYATDAAPSKPIVTDIDSEEDDRLRPTPKDSPILTRLSGPKEPPRNHSTSWPSQKSDKRKAKMHKYKVGHFDKSDADRSACSVNSEFGVPIMKTPIIKKALADTNEKLHCLTKEKNVVT